MRTNYKLGRKPATRPIGLKDLRCYTKADAFPAPPDTFGDLAVLQAISWGMDLNDTEGDCVIAAKDHLIAVWNVLFGQSDPRPTIDQIGSLYKQLSPDDTGCNEADVLKLWQTEGVWGNKIAAYGPLDHRSVLELKQGVAFFGAIDLGIACPDSAQEQFGEQEQSGQLVPWTVVPGATVEGGHDICSVGYTLDGHICVTWGTIVLVTWDFLRAYLEEAWAPLSQELVEKGSDTLGLDVPTLLKDLPSV